MSTEQLKEINTLFFVDENSRKKTIPREGQSMYGSPRVKNLLGVLYTNHNSPKSAFLRIFNICIANK